MRHALSTLGISPESVFPIWYFPGIAQYSQLLHSHGLETLSAAMIPREVQLDDPETGLRDWIRMFAGKVLQVVPEQKVKDFYTLVEAFCRVQLFRDGSWHADYRRIRVVARKRG
jgi:hypothetical protein